MKKVGIIGGGASGLIASIYAAKSGARVVLFEKQKTLGRKLLATGNGRCNISNTSIDISRYHGRNPRFVHSIFARYGLDETIEFFNAIGLPLIEGESGKLYPASLQASTVLELLTYEAEHCGVDIRLHRRIDSIVNQKDTFILVTAGKEKFEFDSIILSAGSCANSQLGASSIGYELASALGHTVVEPFPAILPITIPLKAVHKLQGIKCQAKISIQNNSKILAKSDGELLFTAYGISGPAALDVSRSVNELVLKNHNPDIVIDLYPGYSEKDLYELLESLWGNEEKQVGFSLVGIMHRRMPEVLLHLLGIDPNIKVKSLAIEEKRRIATMLKKFVLKPGKPRNFSEAVVAAGGVSVDEVDGSTMESKRIKNLFITGEILDIDGDSGGYNLQFAWSTGAIAGLSQKNIKTS